VLTASASYGWQGFHTTGYGTGLRRAVPCVKASWSRLTWPGPDLLLSHCLRRVYPGARETLEVVLAH
jgi:hypothetical protein